MAYRCRNCDLRIDSDSEDKVTEMTYEALIKELHESLEAAPTSGDEGLRRLIIAIGQAVLELLETS